IKSNAEGISANKGSISTLQGVTIYAAFDGVYESKNFGKSWRKVFNSQPVVGIFASGSSIYVASYNSLSVSKNDGESWSNISPKYTSNDVYDQIVVNDGVIYLAANSGLYISSDSGESWSKENFGLTDIGKYSAYALYSGSNAIYVGTNKGLFIYNEDSAQWIRITESDGLASNNVNYIAGYGQNIYASTDKGLSISFDDGKTWVAKQFAGQKISQLAIVNSKLMYAIQGHSLYKTENGGNVWTKVEGVSGWRVSYNAGVLLLGCGADGLKISRDQGKTWALINNHKEFASFINNSAKALQIKNIANSVGYLSNIVGNANSGLVKSVATNKGSISALASTVGDKSKGTGIFADIKSNAEGISA
ncbi:WD40/YVTN/BNR-like repeat-containing protein, partial [Fangia hongkongensis]|uniref:WD40/YVTN/BNR-like repeat-containing protein n=1 Tax=Fangia hongkongensis TaxID=270495 RepID=UPI001906E980